MKLIWKKWTAALTATSLLFTISGCSEQEPEWEKSITEYTIEIPELKEEYSFLFLTDTHMIVRDEQDTQQVEDNAAPRYKDFRNAEGISSSDQFSEWIAYANDQETDGLLLGGDIIDYPSGANVKYLDSQLKELKVPYLYTLGNHDWTYPWEYMTELGEDTYLPMLEPYMKGETAIHYMDCGEFLIVSVDNSSNQVNEDALKQYEEILALGKPVILLVHVPFLTQSVLTKAKRIWKTGVVLGGGNYGGIYPNESSRRFMDMTTAADSPVAAVLAGHVHFADFDYIVGEKKVLQIVGAAGYKGEGALIRVASDF